MSLRQRFIRGVLSPIDMWRSHDLDQLRYLRDFERSQYLPGEELRAIQFGRLKAILVHAHEQCPFYRERFDRVGLHPGDVKSLEDLRTFPILEKRDIQESRDRMVARDWPKDDLIPNYTGGSTGAPLTFFLSNDRRRSRWAATIRHNRWAGWDLGDKTASLWGALADAPRLNRLQSLRIALLEPNIFLNTAHVTERELLELNESMKRFRPRVILAYARSAALFARLLKDRGLATYRPHSIVTTAEVLEPEDRAVIEEVFGCPVFNRYGCREVSVIASECPEHRGLHTMAEGLYIEIVRGDERVEAGESGDILVTDLLNYAMPLIRYRIGDIGAWQEERCPCGRGLPLLHQVMGRATDFLVGHDGRLVSGPFLTLAMVGKRPTLGQLQIIQDEIGKVHLRICPGHKFRQEEDVLFLEETARRYLGEDAVVTWELVDELRSEPSGKFLFCKSSVAPGFLRASAPAPIARGDRPGG